MIRAKQDADPVYGDDMVQRHVQENVSSSELQLAQDMLTEVKTKFPFGVTYSADVVSKELSALVRKENYVRNFDPGVTHYLHLNDVSTLETLGYQNEFHQVIPGYVVWISRKGDRWHLNFV